MPTRPPIHRPAGWKPKVEVQREYDTHRGTAAARGYDHKWRLLRQRFIQAHPLCRKCEEAGEVMVAVIVDHVIPIGVDWSRRLDEENLQALCDHHHRLKSEEDRRKYGTAYATPSRKG